MTRKGPVDLSSMDRSFFEAPEPRRPGRAAVPPACAGDRAGREAGPGFLVAATLRERREVGGQAALAKSAMGLTSASNSGSKPDPSLPLRTAHWSRRSAPLRDHRICWDLFMRRLTRKLAVPSVIDVPTRRP